MENVLNLQVSLFGDFKDIVFNSKSNTNPLEFLDFDTFFSDTIDVQMEDPENNSQYFEKRSRFFSENLSIEVVFLSNRIDFNYFYNEIGPKYTSVYEIFSLLEKLMTKINEKFGTLNGNRLAVNGNILMSRYSLQDLYHKLEKFYSPISSLQGEELEEWSARSNYLVSVAVSKNDSEKCNCIIDLNKVRNAIHTEDVRMMVLLDINTVPSSTDTRFNMTNLLYFAPKASKLMDEFLQELERKFE